MRIESRKVKAHEVKMGDRTGLFADWIVEEIRHKKAPRNAVSGSPYEVEILFVHSPRSSPVERPQWHRHNYSDMVSLTTIYDD